MPRGCQSITAIIPPTAENQDLLPGTITTKHEASLAGDAARRILHQRNPRNVILLDREPIYLPSLFTCKSEHDNRKTNIPATIQNPQSKIQNHVPSIILPITC